MSKFDKIVYRLSVGGTRIALTLLMFAGTPALAAKSLPMRSAGPHYEEPATTGSLADGTGRSGDATGRSSALGNAEFPERALSSQNFGNVAGGGLN